MKRLLSKWNDINQKKEFDWKYPEENWGFLLVSEVLVTAIA